MISRHQLRVANEIENYYFFNIMYCEGNFMSSTIVRPDLTFSR